MDCAVEHPYRSGRFAGGSEEEPLRPGGLALTRRAAQWAGFAAGQRILDLGCGEGHGTRVLDALGCRVIGLDVSTTALTAAALRLPGVPLIVADAQHLPLADAALDGILAECALSLAVPLRGVLAECRRVLRPGGRLAITDMFVHEHPAAGDDSPLACRGLCTRDALYAELAAAGFDVELWEDHSPVLRTFLARLIFESSLPHSSHGLCGGDDASLDTIGAALRRRRPGYYLLIAARSEREP